MSEELSQIQKVEPVASKAMVHQIELRYGRLFEAPIGLAVTCIRAVCVEECLFSIFALVLHGLFIGYGGYMFYATYNLTAFYWLGGAGSVVVMMIYPALYRTLILPPKRRNSLISARSVLLWMVYLTSFYGLTGSFYQAYTVTHDWSNISQWSDADFYWPLDAMWSNCCILITAWLFAGRYVIYCETCLDDRNRRSASFLGSGKTAVKLIALASSASLLYLGARLTLANAIDDVIGALFFLAVNGAGGFLLFNAYTKQVPKNVDIGFELR